jgi:Mrp family chromosome partitioning ATPase
LLADSYRTIGNVVGFVQQSQAPTTRAPVTLVVSPGPSDGKTSIAVNLAAALAETGKRTIVANADFRRPRLHRYLFGTSAPSSPLGSEDVALTAIGSLVADTDVENLKCVDLSGIEATPGELVRSLVGRLDELRTVSDQIVIDSSPLGATAEVLELLPLADVIVLVNRVGHTSFASAARSTAVLQDFATSPVVLVLSGLKADRSQFYEYDDRRSNVRPEPQVEQPTLEAVE